jgi:hypothetical protein
MKMVIVILVMIVAAGALLQSVASSSKSDSIDILGPEGSVFFIHGTDAKRVEDKMAEALVKLNSWKRARSEEKTEPLVRKIEQDELSSRPLVNSTLNNISIISSLNNSSLLNSSAAQVVDANKIDANSLSGRQNVASSSKGSLNGYYGMTASRHEMGKSGIKSKMFLSGNFEMDKTVKFQDQGVD